MTSHKKTAYALALSAAGACCFSLLSPVAPAGAQGVRAECPVTLSCDFQPAAYQQTGDPDDKGSYGNYDTSDRPKTNKIKYIVLHDTEETYADTLKIFKDPNRAVSAHYVVRSGDGHVTQMVKTKDVAWQAGNWWLNTHSIGIEQEGFATDPSYFTPQLYRSTAKLVRYLAAKYDIPLDRRHILGHDNVAGIDSPHVKGMHWDPGTYWDWNYFMKLLGRPTRPTARHGSDLVTVNPVFKQNVQAFRDCEKNVDLPAQPSSAVPLHTAPAKDAPLFSDPGLHTDGGAGTDCAADWGSKINATQQAVVAERRHGWTAIWWAGQKAWFETPRHTRVTTPTSGYVVKPKHGKAEVPTYGVVYPDASEYPADFTGARTGSPLPYTIKAGQAYPGGEWAPNGYYNAPTIDASQPYDHVYFAGGTKYVAAQIGHRVVFVKAADVDIVRVH